MNHGGNHRFQLMNPGFRKQKKTWVEVFWVDLNLTTARICTSKYSTGWWLSHPSEKYEFVSWDDDIPNIYGKMQKMATKPPRLVCS